MFQFFLLLLIPSMWSTQTIVNSKMLDEHDNPRSSRQSINFGSMCNTLFKHMLKDSAIPCAFVGSEDNNLHFVDSKQDSKYLICFDALDGLITHNSPVGSAFAIYKVDESRNRKCTIKNILKPGREVICAGYAVYASSTVIILSLGSGWGVNGFQLDPDTGEFLLTCRNIIVPEHGPTYSINEKYSEDWTPAITEYIIGKKKPRYGAPYSLFYSGIFIADIHATLKHGGIFMYPSNKKYPQGKLTLLFACIPVAFIFKEAGGMATNGSQNILDIQPNELHHLTSCFIGSKEDVLDLMATIKRGKM